MIDDKNVQKHIAEAISNIHFEKVSDLSKNEFTQILALAITSVLNSSDFSDNVSSDLVSRSVRRNRGRL